MQRSSNNFFFLGNMYSHIESTVESAQADKGSNIKQGNMKQCFNKNVDAFPVFLFDRRLLNVTVNYNVNEKVRKTYLVRIEKPIYHCCKSF